MQGLTSSQSIKTFRQQSRRFPIEIVVKNRNEFFEKQLLFGFGFPVRIIARQRFMRSLFYAFVIRSLTRDRESKVDWRGALPVGSLTLFGFHLRFAFTTTTARRLNFIELFFSCYLFVQKSLKLISTCLVDLFIPNWFRRVPLARLSEKIIGWT